MLFDSSEKPLNQYGYSRTNDPDTSKEAITESTASLARAQFVRGLKICGKPSTANEIAEHAENQMKETVRKRAKEVVRAELVVEFGKRKCEVTGKNATTYKLK